MTWTIFDSLSKIIVKLPPVEHNAAQIILIDFDVCCTKFWIVNVDNFLISLFHSFKFPHAFEKQISKAYLETLTSLMMMANVFP